MRPRLLDLFCGQGGASMGYHLAGFDVVGVDIDPQPRYPFEFHQADALTFPLDGFDYIHASPPCQAYSVTQHRTKREHPKLVELIRRRLIGAGVPYVIENVVGAPLINPTTLCGTMFGLRVKRHRLFESNSVLYAPRLCNHNLFPQDIPIMNHGWKMTRFVPVYGSGGCKARELWDSAMGVDWMDSRGLTQAIPPAYSEWIGRNLIHNFDTQDVERKAA